MHEYQHSADIFVNISLTHFMALVFFYISRGFVMFLGDIDRDQCHEMGSESFNTQLLISLLISVTEDSLCNWTASYKMILI